MNYETPVPLAQFNTQQATGSDSSDAWETQELTNVLYETSSIDNDNAGKQKIYTFFSDDSYNVNSKLIVFISSYSVETTANSEYELVAQETK